MPTPLLLPSDSPSIDVLRPRLQPRHDSLLTRDRGGPTFDETLRSVTRDRAEPPRQTIDNDTNRPEEHGDRPDASKVADTDTPETSAERPSDEVAADRTPVTNEGGSDETGDRPSDETGTATSTDATSADTTSTATGSDGATAEAAPGAHDTVDGRANAAHVQVINPSPSETADASRTESSVQPSGVGQTRSSQNGASVDTTPSVALGSPTTARNAVNETATPGAGGETVRASESASDQPAATSQAGPAASGAASNEHATTTVAGGLDHTTAPSSGNTPGGAADAVAAGISPALAGDRAEVETAASPTAAGDAVAVRAARADRSDTSTDRQDRQDGRRAATTTASNASSGSAASARAEQIEQAVRLENTTGAPPVRSAEPQPGAAPRLGDLGLERAATTRDPEPELPATRTAGRIMQGLSAMVNQRGGSLTMRLDPPEMGQLRIQMTINQGTVSAQFTPSTAQAQALLERNMATLRIALEDQGLTVERLSVQSAVANQSGGGESNSSPNDSSHQERREQSQQQQYQQQQRFDDGSGQGRSRQDLPSDFATVMDGSDTSVSERVDA